MELNICSFFDLKGHAPTIFANTPKLHLLNVLQDFLGQDYWLFSGNYGELNVHLANLLDVQNQHPFVVCDNGYVLLFVLEQQIEH